MNGTRGHVPPRRRRGGTAARQWTYFNLSAVLAIAAFAHARILIPPPGAPLTATAPTVILLCTRAWCCTNFDANGTGGCRVDLGRRANFPAYSQMEPTSL